MYTRREIVNLSVKIGCKKDLIQKGMVVSPNGDVICIAALSGNYPDGIYFRRNIKSPKEAEYCGVYSIRAEHRLDPRDSETRKNIAVTYTNGKSNYVYFFEKAEYYLDEYFFHGRYKYISHEFIESDDPNHKDKEILFHLLFIDRPILLSINPVGTN